MKFNHFEIFPIEVGLFSPYDNLVKELQSKFVERCLSEVTAESKMFENYKQNSLRPIFIGCRIRRELSEGLHIQWILWNH